MDYLSLSAPAIFNVSGSPVINAGTFTVTFVNQSGNTVLASPNGSTGVPSFRSLVPADIPTLNQNTTGVATTAINISGGSIGGIPYQSGTSTTVILAAGTSGQILKSNGSSAPSWVNQSSITAGGLSTTLAVGSGGTGLTSAGTSGNVLTSNGSTWTSSPAVSSTPTGSIIAFAGTTAPAGWLLCDGTNTYSRTTYAALFAVIGSIYDNGNGSSTFGVPDLRSRTIIGVGTGVGLTNRGLAVKVGTETVTLNYTQIPAHSHPNVVYGGSTGGMSANQVHSHSAVWVAGGGQIGRGAYGFANLGGGYQGRLIVSGGSEYGQYCTVGDSPNLNHTHTFTPSISNANNTGGGYSHDNMQPSIALNYIIKT